MQQDVFVIMDSLQKIDRLSDVYQWSTDPVIKQMSVAEHSYYVAMCAMFVYDILLKHDYININKNDSYISEMVLRKALLHDVEECVLSDIPHKVKNLIGKDIMQRTKGDVIHDILPGILSFNAECCINCKSGVSGNIVRLADRLALLLYMLKEIKLGNTYMQEELGTVCQVTINESGIGFTKDIVCDIIQWVSKKSGILIPWWNCISGLEK